MENGNDSKMLDGAVTVEWSDDYSEEKTQELTLFTILNRLIAAIFFPSPNSSAPLLQRIKTSFSENIPLLRDASGNTAHRVLLWTRQGSPLRALLVVSVGTIVSLTLAGMLVFMLFFVAATVNAIVISLVMSLAAAGGFLALFFACVAAIYVGALSVAVFVISATTISCIIAVLVATGWIGFFWTLWIAAQKSLGLAKHSVSMKDQLFQLTRLLGKTGVATLPRNRSEVGKYARVSQNAVCLCCITLPYKYQ